MVRPSTNWSSTAITTKTITEYWTDPTVLRPSPLNVLLETSTRKPPVIATAAPRNTRLVASVARNAFTRSLVTSSPLTRPSSAAREDRCGQSVPDAEVDGGLGGADAGRRVHRPEREVEVPRDDHQRHRARHDPDRRVLVEDVEQVVGGQKRLRSERQPDEQRREDDEDAVVANVLGANSAVPPRLRRDDGVRVRRCAHRTSA